MTVKYLLFVRIIFWSSCLLVSAPNGGHFAGKFSTCISVNDRCCISTLISLKCLPMSSIDSSAMAWCRTCKNPLFSSDMFQWHSSLAVSQLKHRSLIKMTLIWVSEAGLRLDAMPLAVVILIYCQLCPWEQSQWNTNGSANTFVHVNLFEDAICIAPAILPRSRCSDMSVVIETVLNVHSDWCCVNVADCHCAL